MSIPSAEIIRARWLQAQSRGVTQNEFARVTLGTSDRYLRKIIAGDRTGVKLKAKADRGGGFVQQTYKQGGQLYSTMVEIPHERSRLDYFTPTGQRDMKRAVRETARQRAAELQTPLARRWSPKVGPDYRALNPNKPVHFTKARLRDTAHVPVAIMRKGRG